MRHKKLFQGLMKIERDSFQTRLELDPGNNLGFALRHPKEGHAFPIPRGSASAIPIYIVENEREVRSPFAFQRLSGITMPNDLHCSSDSYRL